MATLRPGLLLLALLAGCAGSAPARPGALMVEARPARIAGAPASPPEPRVPGPWTCAVLTGAPVGANGIVATPSGPALYVGAGGGGRFQLARHDGRRWRFETVIAGPYAYGRIAAHGERLAMTALKVTLAPAAMVDEVVAVVPGKAPQRVLGPCSPSDAHLVAFDSRGPLVVGGCGERMAVVEERGGRWAERGSWAGRARITGVAVDALDRVHVQLIAPGGPRHFIVRGAKREEVPLPAKARPLDLSACRGVVFGTFERGGPRPGVDFGSFRGGRWELEKIVDDELLWGLLGFDEECRPFVSSVRDVWSRGRRGWVKSSSCAGTIKGVVGHRGTLYAITEELKDGVSVGVATAPLVAAPR